MEVALSPDLESLERALDALLTAIITEDWKVREAAAGPANIVAAAVTAESLERAGRMTRLDLDVADLVRNPVRAACRQAVRRIGERLFKVCGTISGMSQVAERVAAWDPPQYGMRAAIIDHAWDGVGEGTNRWFA